MLIYRLEKAIKEYTIDEEDFLNYLKNQNLKDEDIQNSNNAADLKEKFGFIGEFSAELDSYLQDKEETLVGSQISYYDDYGDACYEWEWGRH